MPRLAASLMKVWSGLAGPAVCCQLAEQKGSLDCVLGSSLDPLVPSAGRLCTAAAAPAPSLFRSQGIVTVTVERTGTVTVLASVVVGPVTVVRPPGTVTGTVTV
jgi:hypothetical protein